MEWQDLLLAVPRNGVLNGYRSELAHILCALEGRSSALLPGFDLFLCGYLPAHQKEESLKRAAINALLSRRAIACTHISPAFSLGFFFVITRVYAFV